MILRMCASVDVHSVRVINSINWGRPLINCANGGERADLLMAIVNRQTTDNDCCRGRGWKGGGGQREPLHVIELVYKLPHFPISHQIPCTSYTFIQPSKQWVQQIRDNVLISLLTLYRLVAPHPIIDPNRSLMVLLFASRTTDTLSRWKLISAPASVPSQCATEDWTSAPQLPSRSHLTLFN